MKFIRNAYDPETLAEALALVNYKGDLPLRFDKIKTGLIHDSIRYTYKLQSSVTQPRPSSTVTIFLDRELGKALETELGIIKTVADVIGDNDSDAYESYKRVETWARIISESQVIRSTVNGNYNTVTDLYQKELQRLLNDDLELQARLNNTLRIDCPICKTTAQPAITAYISQYRLCFRLIKQDSFKADVNIYFDCPNCGRQLHSRTLPNVEYKE